MPFGIRTASKPLATAENAAAADIRLTKEELDRIESVLPKGVAAGERYNEAGMRTVNG